MDRLDRMDRRARYAVGGAVAFVGVLLLVLGWYLISGQAIAAKQLPYLASASLPGAVLVICGTLFLLTGSADRDAEAARQIAELHALLTEAIGEAAPVPAPAFATDDPIVTPPVVSQRSVAAGDPAPAQPESAG